MEKNLRRNEITDILPKYLLNYHFFDVLTKSIFIGLKSHDYHNLPLLVYYTILFLLEKK